MRKNKRFELIQKSPILYNMDKLLKQKMTVDEFLHWYENQTNSQRYELVDGIPIAMSPERVRHAKVKHFAANALEQALKNSTEKCHVLPDGMTVKINEHTSYEPDALVYCGDEVDEDRIDIPEPIIIVEVLSPGTKNLDTTSKLSGYLSLSSVKHYLVIDPVAKIIIHHAKLEKNKVLTAIIREGSFTLNPPNLKLHHNRFFNS